MIKAYSEFIDNNTNLRYYPLLINNDTMYCNNAPLLIITNNSNNKVYIPKDIIICTSEEIMNDQYSINDIILTARPNGIKTDTKPIKPTANFKQKNCNTNTILDFQSTIRLHSSHLKQSKAFKRKDIKCPNPLARSNVITSPYRH